MNFLFQMFVDVQAFLERGGNVLFAIMIAVFFMWALILERFIFFTFLYKDYRDQVIQGWQSRNEKKSWYAKQVRRLTISQTSQKLHFSLAMIKTLIALCPLFGLLGTVTGMIEVFDVMAMVGTGNARAMASGVSKATIPTMAGMMAALSGVYFSARLDRLAKKKLGEVEGFVTEETEVKVAP